MAAEGHTLHSRLRVLVAKSFRAEKLYASIRNSRKSGDGGVPISAIAEIANDIRAKEWQKSYGDLRTELNDIVASGGSGGALLTTVVSLSHRFKLSAEESAAKVEIGNKGLMLAAKRHEFGHVLKLTLELIRHRARAQASQVISDELQSLLEASGRAFDPSAYPALESVPVSGQVVGSQISKEISADDLDAPDLPSNVIPLPRRASAGGSRS